MITLSATKSSNESLLVVTPKAIASNEMVSCVRFSLLEIKDHLFFNLLARPLKQSLTYAIAEASTSVSIISLLS
ncbi:hypothetical protein D3C75_1330510 [compost metagenome]